MLGILRKYSSRCALTLMGVSLLVPAISVAYTASSNSPLPFQDDQFYAPRILAAYGSGPAQDPETEALLREADRLNEHGQWEEAASVFERGLARLDSQQEPVTHAQVVFAIACLYMNLHRYSEAETQFTHAHGEFSAAIGKNSLMAGLTLQHLALVQLPLGKDKQAEQAMLEAYGFIKQDLGETDPGTLVAAELLAELFYAEGKYKLGDRYLYPALATAKASPQLSKMILGHMTLIAGMSLISRGQSEEGKPYLLKALEMFQSISPPRRGEVAMASFWLGVLFTERHAVADAERYSREALALNKGLKGSAGNVADCYNLLGQALFGAGKYDEAVTSFKAAYDIQRATLGAQHVNTNDSLFRWAAARCLQGKCTSVQDAKDVDGDLRNALAVLEKSPKDILAAAEAADRLGYAYVQQHNYTDAVAAYLQSLAIREKMLGRGDPGTNRTRIEVGMSWFAQGAYAQAEPFLREAIEAEARTSDHPDSFFAEAEKELAQIALNKGDVSEARTHLDRAREIALTLQSSSGAVQAPDGRP